MNRVYPCFFLIPNLNLKRDLVECVSSILHAGAAGEVRVVVIDNGSTDGSVDELIEVFGRRVSVLRNTRNLGFARAVNQGIHFALDAGAASVFVLNNDTILLQDTIMTLSVFASESTEEVGILGPAIFYADYPQKLWRIGDRRTAIGGIPRPFFPRSEKVVELDYVTGCGMLIFNSVFEKVGLLDDEFFMYYEDADFCHRARKGGFRILGIPQAKLLHKISKSAAKDPRVAHYWRAFGMMRFYKKHALDFDRRVLLWFLGIKLMHMLLHASKKPSCVRLVIEGARDGLLSKH